MASRRLLANVVVLSTAAASASEGTCPAEGCALAERVHHWPNVRGKVGSYGVSPLPGPRNLSEPAWRWHSPKGQYGTTVVGGPVIDNERNLYIVEVKGVHKFTPEGKLLWSQIPDPFFEVTFPDGPSLYGDSVFVSTSRGELCSFDIATGAMRWKQRYFADTGGDSKYVTASEGVVIMGTDNAKMSGGGSLHVVGVDAESGWKLWDFKPDAPTWNNMGIFPGDDTLVFQDWDARVYRLGLHNGSLLWKAGGMSKGQYPPAPIYSKTWTDGGTLLGADGVVYAASSKSHQFAAATAFSGGGIYAYRLSDGELLWSKDLDHPFLTWPVAAKLPGESKFTVFAFPAAGNMCMDPTGPPKILAFVCTAEFLCYMILFPPVLALCWGFYCCCNCRNTACSRRCRNGLLLSLAIYAVATLAGSSACRVSWRLLGDFKAENPAAIVALDAETGVVRWEHEVARWSKLIARGDLEGLELRKSQPWRGMCCPVAYSSPSVDGNGVVYIGHQSGFFFGVKDHNNDSVISDSEVDKFDAQAAFLHSGPAFAPGLFAFTTCDSLWVYKT